MIKVTTIEANMYRFIWWIVVITFRSSNIINDVNVIVTILTKDCSNRFIASTMMKIPW